MILKRFKCLFIVMLVFLSACTAKNAPATTDDTPTGGSLSNEPGISTSKAVILTNTPEPSPTPTVPPTATFTPEAAPTEPTKDTSTPLAALPACINRASLVRHLSFGDGSSIFSGSFFGKAWRIQNSGTCTWTTAYALVFSSGEQLDAPAETFLPHYVKPGETIDIQILMKSPDVANSYSGNWMLRDPNGALFGTGELADQPIEVQIVVKNPSTKDLHPFPECG
jgi:hypothetical protein